MKITNTAKSGKFSEKTITIEKLDNGEFKVTAMEDGFELGRARNKHSVEMTFTKNGFNALIGSMRAMSGEFEQD